MEVLGIKLGVTDAVCNEMLLGIPSVQRNTWEANFLNMSCRAQTKKPLAAE